MIRAAALALAALSLAACETTGKREPEIRTVRVEVPVPVTCVPKAVSGPPAYPDTDAALKAAPGAAERYQLMAAGRLLRIARQAITEPVIAACR